MNESFPGPQAGPVTGHVPVLRLGEVLLVTLQGDLHDSTAQQLQQDLAETISRTGTTGVITGVIIDISGVEIVDSFLGRVLAEIAGQTELLAARSVVVGMRPAVAITLVELGLTLPGVHTALSTEVAMDLLTRHAPSSRFGGLRQESP
ncbi:STAS domain-containing protein [Streptomyces pactum]|uniref:Anti-anti-sigma factor n=1 Tax=Streptomyces pactum TaxID=68249 RepID=A0A1S6JHH3_9ACTN|nr:STAS domain-containing protein [Streptomyces pactum]AQS71208.1 anti-anti-sigma factor [Streptomyces pactum]